MELTRLIETSDRLHARVQLFARGASEESFDQLALEIAHFQLATSAGFRRLLKAREAQLTSVDDIPAVPADAFRLTRVASHPPELDRLRFATSGTTTAAQGLHCMRRSDSYEQLSLLGGRHALLRRASDSGEHVRPVVVVALAPRLSEPPTSSLGYMFARFMAAFGDPSAEPCWLVDEGGVDLAGLRRAAESAATAQQPVLVLATAFALLRLLDQLGGAPLPLPRASVVLQTGGFKGRTREISAEDLRQQLSAAFGLDAARVVGEYGMTELTSQLYEPTIAESGLAQGRASSAERAYVEPAWLRVTPVHPVTLRAVAEGEPGLARFVDLGNVDSAVSVVTQDLVRRVPGGIQLLGRQPGAPARGCSLSIEALLGG